MIPQCLARSANREEGIHGRQGAQALKQRRAYFSVPQPWRGRLRAGLLLCQLLQKLLRQSQPRLRPHCASVIFAALLCLPPRAPDNLALPHKSIHCAVPRGQQSSRLPETLVQENHGGPRRVPSFKCIVYKPGLLAELQYERLAPPTRGNRAGPMRFGSTSRLVQIAATVPQLPLGMRSRPKMKGTVALSSQASLGGAPRTSRKQISYRNPSALKSVLIKVSRMSKVKLGRNRMVLHATKCTLRAGTWWRALLLLKSVRFLRVLGAALFVRSISQRQEISFRMLGNRADGVKNERQ